MHASYSSDKNNFVHTIWHSPSWIKQGSADKCTGTRGINFYKLFILGRTTQTIHYTCIPHVTKSSDRYTVIEILYSTIADAWARDISPSSTPYWEWVSHESEVEPPLSNGQATSCLRCSPMIQGWMYDSFIRFIHSITTFPCKEGRIPLPLREYLYAPPTFRSAPPHRHRPQ